jgi:pimeloyl-ACP methyl ester carboxylesterase
MSATATQVTQLTAPNHTIEAPKRRQLRLPAPRRALHERSAARAAPPLPRNLDNWGPALVDALARTREVILFDNAGVGRSTGTVPRTVTAMAHDAFAFIDALKLPATLEARDAQLDAITTWGIPDASRLGRLAGITQPVLVANGDDDRLVPTKNSYLLAERLTNARLKIYPDAGHGFLFQYPADFASEVECFLNDGRAD